MTTEVRAAVARAAHQPFTLEMALLEDPKPGVQLTAFASDGLELTISFWIGDPENGTGSVKSDVNMALLRLFNAKGIEIPFPQRVLRVVPAQGGAAPDEGATADIARGREVLRALSPYDIGQAAVVIDGHVVGVEDIEGTDGLLARVTRLREEGRIRAKAARGVLVKAPKSGQDLRFDLPTMGPRTVEGAAAAKLAGIAIVAGNTLVVDPQAMIAAADAAGLFVTGLPA